MISCARARWAVQNERATENKNTAAQCEYRHEVVLPDDSRLSRPPREVIEFDKPVHAHPRPSSALRVVCERDRHRTLNSWIRDILDVYPLVPRASRLVATVAPLARQSFEAPIVLAAAAEHR